jgi:hypothetical protein
MSQPAGPRRHLEVVAGLKAACATALEAANAATNLAAVANDGEASPRTCGRWRPGNVWPSQATARGGKLLLAQATAFAARVA